MTDYFQAYYKIVDNSSACCVYASLKTLASYSNCKQLKVEVSGLRGYVVAVIIAITLFMVKLIRLF